MPIVVTLTHGTRRYASMLTRIRNDPDLVVAMWRDAESLPTELDVPGTQWSIALVGGEPAAWCAATIADGVLKCHSNYDRPGYRHHQLYPAAYAERHRTVVAPCGLTAVTYLFADPIPLHQADRWVLTGRDGAGVLPEHHWYELRREADEHTLAELRPVPKMDTPRGLFKGVCSCGKETATGSEDDARTAWQAHADAKNTAVREE